MSDYLTILNARADALRRAIEALIEAGEMQMAAKAGKTLYALNQQIKNM